MTNISRLLKTPCPVCRKDFICKCMEAFTADFEGQMLGNEWIDKAIAE
jgi:hypothetical protein